MALLLVEKNEKLLHCKASHIFSTKNIWHFSDISIRNFSETLTYNVVNFEQLDPDW